MSDYRIKKGGREFTVTRTETLLRLAERGLLLPDDPVSEDGGEFRPAGQVAELRAVLEAAATVTPPRDDPWRHWVGGSLDSGGPDEGVLACFLGQIESTPLPSLAARGPATPPPMPARHVVHAEPEVASGPGVGGGLPGPAGEVREEPALPASKPGQAEGLDARPGDGGHGPAHADSGLAGPPDPTPGAAEGTAGLKRLPATPAATPVAATTSGGSGGTGRPGRRGLSLGPRPGVSKVPASGGRTAQRPIDGGEMPSPNVTGSGLAADLEAAAASGPEAPATPEVDPDPPDSSSQPAEGSALVASSEGPAPPEGTPLAFGDWVKARHGAGGGASRLEGFGRYDDGIVIAAGRPSRRIDFFRVTLLILLGATLIGLRWMWVRTVAQVSYPRESEIVRARAPEPPSAGLRGIDQGGPQPDSGLTREQIEQRERERGLRLRLQGQIIDFNTAGQLEDALFRELVNRGLDPQKVTVESLHERGTQDVEHRRPTQADLAIELSGVSEAGDGGYDQLEERLVLCWLLVGKYQTLGRVTFEDVSIKVAPPLPFQRTWEGRRLASLWEQQLTTADLFLE